MWLSDARAKSKEKLVTKLVAPLVVSLLGIAFAMHADEKKPSAESSTSVEEMLVEFASTPAEHRALAAHFRTEAAAARREAARHRSMAKHYAGGKLMQRDAARAHCDRLAKRAEQSAAEYDGLAAAHEAEAGR